MRVRLLIDDLYTGGDDDFFLGLRRPQERRGAALQSLLLGARPGQAARFVASMGDWGRVNHRMHNKLFIADGAMAVIGGRNVANEYFLRSIETTTSSTSMPSPSAGWSRRCRPCSTATGTPTRSTRSQRWTQHAARASCCAPSSKTTGPGSRRRRPLPPNDILGYGPIADDLDVGRLGLIWGEAYVFADHPDKPFDGEVGGELLETSVTYNVFEAIRKAQREVVLSSPYFVPGKHGMELLRELRSKGVKVSV